MGDTLIGLVSLGLLRASLLLRNWVVLLWGSGWGADFRFTDEDGSGFDGEGASLDVSDHFGTGFDFDTVGADDIAVNFSVDYDGFCFDFGFDVGVFCHGQGTVGADFTLDSAINQEVVGETNRAFDVNVVAKNVALTAGGR